MDFTPLKGNDVIYRKRTRSDFALTKKHLTYLSLICLVYGVMIVSVLRNEDLSTLLSTLFANLLLVVFLYSFLGGRIKKSRRKRWEKFIAVNKLKTTIAPLVPPVFSLSLGVDFGYASAITVNNYELAVHSVLYRTLLSDARRYKAKRKNYTTICFTLRKNLPHIFINVKANDPLKSILDATNIENIYGVSSFSKQKVKHTTLSDVADIYCNKLDADANDTVLHKLSGIHDLFNTAPEFDIEIYNQQIWLIFNGDNRTPEKLPEILKIADRFKESLLQLETLGREEPYTHMKVQKTIRKTTNT